MGKLYSASVQIRDPKGNYLWIRRSPTARSRPGHYEHSGGRSEPGETAREAAVREIREETGIKIREDELRLVDRKTGPKGDHVTFSHVVRKAVIPKLSFEHDAYVWSPEKPALTNGFLSKYMKGKDTSAMTTKQKATGAAIGVATTAATRAAGKAIAKKMAARAAASAAAKVGTAGTGVGVFVTGGMMVADAAPEAWAVTKETLAVPGQISRKVWEAKGVGGKLKAAASGSGKAFLDLSTVPLRVGAASIFGSGTVKMAREAAGEAMAARKGARQNGIGTSLVRVMGKAAGHAPAITGHAGTLLREGGKLVGLAATTVIGGTVALKTAKAAWRDAKNNPSSVDANMVEISKMLKNMPAGWRAQYEAGRNALADLGGPVLPRNPRPEQAANLMMLAAGAGHLDRRNDHPFGDIPVPEAVREAAMEGLRMSHKMSYGADHFIGIARAIQLAIADGVPASTLKRMKGYLSRHRSDKEGTHFNDEAQPSNGRMAWMNWGGDPGARWSSSTLSSKANPMSAYFRHNPYFVTRGGQAVPKAIGEERSTWQAAASHAERQEGEGTLYRIGQRDASGRWPILNRRTGQDTGKYGMTLEGAQEVLKRLIRRTNPAASTLVGDGYGVRMRDLVREGQGAELPKSTKAKKAQGAQARGKKAKAKSKRNPSPGFTTEEWLADVEGEEWANYDLNRAGIMHYSGSGIPTYRSLYR